MSCDSFFVRRFRSCLGGREEEKGGLTGTQYYSFCSFNFPARRDRKQSRCDSYQSEHFSFCLFPCPTNGFRGARASLMYLLYFCPLLSLFIVFAVFCPLLSLFIVFRVSSLTVWIIFRSYAADAT